MGLNRLSEWQLRRRVGTIRRVREAGEPERVFSIRHWFPATKVPVDVAMVLNIATHLSVLRTLYLSARFRGRCLVARGTRLKIGPGAKIEFAEGSFLLMGFLHYTPTPTSMHLGRHATLSVTGTVVISRWGAHIHQ